MGQITGNEQNQIKPKKIMGNIKNFGVGYNFCILLSFDGTLYGFGSNANGTINNKFLSILKK